MTLEEFAARIEESRSKKFAAGPGYVGRCPNCAAGGHDKDCTHFRVYEGQDEWLHVSCIKGCDEASILSALRLENDDRRVKPYEPGTNEEKLPVYTYEKVTGGYAAEKHRRIDKATGKKLCVWKVRFKDGVPLAKIEKTVKRGPNEGKKYMDYPSPEEAGLNGEVDVLYRFSDLRKAITARKTIYIGEGEPASETAKKLGIMHTCQRAGAGKNKWLPVYTAQLSGAKEIVIVADRDKEGDEYSTEVFILLRAAGFSVRVVRSKTTREHDDFRDHLEAGFSESDLVPAPDLMPPRGLGLRRTSADVPPVTVEHLIDPYLPRGSTVLVDGHGGTKKTFFFVCLAAAVSCGYDPISQDRLSRPMRTLVLHKGGTEDDPDGGDNTDEKLNTIYRANGGLGDLLTGDVEKFDAVGLQMLCDTITDEGIDLVVIDYLYLYLTGVVANINDPLQCLPTCRALLRVAKKTNCCIVALRHTSKGGSKDTREASEMGSGSNQWHDAMRGHLVIRKHSDPVHKAKGVVVLTDEKGDLLNHQGDAVIFSRRGDEIFYERSIENPFGGDVAQVADKGKKAMVEAWMVDNLTGQFVNVVEVNARLQAMGVSLPTIKRARSALKVKAIKAPASDGGWMLTIKGEKPDPFAD